MKNPADAPCLSAAKKRSALSEETDLEATTEESIEYGSSSDLEKNKRDEALGADEKVLQMSSCLWSFQDASKPNAGGFMDPADLLCSPRANIISTDRFKKLN